MAELSKSGTPNLSTLNVQPSNKFSGLIAGEAIAAGDMCYVKSDGKVWRASGAAANAAACAKGIALKAADVGEAITLGHGIMVRYGATLTPGTEYFLSGTVAGGLADAASTGGTVPVAFAYDATRLFVYSPRQPV